MRNVTGAASFHGSVPLSYYVVLSTEPVAMVESLEEAPTFGRRDASVMRAEHSHRHRTIGEPPPLLLEPEIKIPVHHPTHVRIDRVGAQRIAADDARDRADVAPV